MAIIRRVTKIANPRKAKSTREQRSNPILLEFGAINPKRSRSVAKVKKHHKSTPRRHAVAKGHQRPASHNPRHRVAKHRPRAKHHNPHMHHRVRRHHNPLGFSSKQLMEMSAGMLVGVAAAKYIPTVLPASVTSALPATSFTAPLITAASTFLAGWAAFKFLPSDVAKGVVLGGSALTLSQVLNVIAPPNIAGPLALAGVGDIVQTQGFTVPDRSVRAPVIQMQPTGVGMYGRGNYRRLAA